MSLRRVTTLSVLVALGLTALLAACSSDSEPPPVDDPFPAPAEGEGFQLSLSFTAPPSSETWKCRISNLPTDRFTYVNHVESLQTPGVHHMDLMTLVFTNLDLAPGDYDCEELYAQYSELMDKGLFLYASQQESQEIQLPEGTVASLPAQIPVMQEIHYVNTTDQPVEVFSKVNVYSSPLSGVQQEIWGYAIRDSDITVPAGTEHTEWTRCVMTDDIDLLFVSSHTHAMGKNVVIKRFDGTNAREEIYRNDDWQTPALESFDTEPLHIAAGTGFEFACNYVNDTNQDVHWGFSAADEMCQIAIVFTPGEAARKCEVVATSSDAPVPAP